MTVNRTELRRALNILCSNRNDLYTEIERLNNKVLADIKEAEASFQNGSMTREEANADITALRAENARLLSVGTPLDEKFVVSHKKAMDGIRNNTLAPVEIARLYAEALDVFETVYAAIHPDTAKAKKAEKAVVKTDDSDSKVKPVVKTDETDDVKKTKPAPKADEDDKAKPVEKPVVKTDETGKDDAPVVDVAGLAALIKSGQDKCDAGFTAVNAEIAKVAKGTLPEDIAEVIRKAGLDKVKALFDGTATTAGLSSDEHALLKLLVVAFNNRTNEEIIDAVGTLMGIDKFSLGLFRRIGN